MAANQNITNKHVSVSSNNLFRYLCPSFLSENDLLQELQIRCFKIKGLDKRSKDELIQIFTKHLMPLPQRLFPNNHHGTLINKMILKENASSRRQQKHEEAKSHLQYGFSREQDSKLSLKSSEKRNIDRLKPPIDSSNIQNKRISFSKTSSPSSSSTASLDKTVINTKCERKSRDETKVGLKRDHSGTVDDDISPTKKSRQRIAWP
ncbi:Ashwin [Frankliniella fusca]|uniref:Ashwin n=1 Tax=Frankliniella fusca TaxID=407009 RepID=A0AAE1HQZ9_9NEOP|nr:Ashwin [Frankliniella fusca]